MDEFFDDAKEELIDALDKYGEFKNLHEAYGVMAEEIAELFDHVRTKEPLRVHEEVYKELVQIAAMAAKAAMHVRSCRSGIVR